MKNKRRKRRKYLNGDRSLRIVARSDPQPRLIGKLGEPKHVIWKKASHATMQELFEKGALNQDQIDKLYEEGIDVESMALKNKLTSLDLENDSDFIAFMEMARANPEALAMMNKIQSTRKKKAEREQNKREEQELEQQLRSLDMDDPEDIKTFVEIQKSNPKAMEILKRL